LCAPHRFLWKTVAGCGNALSFQINASIQKRRHVSSDYFLLLSEFFDDMLDPRLDSGFFLEISKVVFT
jgi:hypothetical protein